MDHKLRMTHVIIHGFAIAHAATAAALSQTIVGDEAALTTLTITMILAIARLYGQTVEVGRAFALLGVFAGTYLGTRGLVFCIKWIPVLGNAANAYVTAITTETLGWVTYKLVSKGYSIENVSKEEIKKLISESKNEAINHKKEWSQIENTINKMSPADKDLYHWLEKRLMDKDINETEQKEIEQQIEELFQKYEKQ